ncbi:MAG: WG repeat-containing protein [Prevotellaceae bacterium]|jgi:hypothetical protein|nr:WG repeat-containing protein [Prevotellaceae bacterium]
MKTKIILPIILLFGFYSNAKPQTDYLYRIDDMTEGVYELGVTKCGYVNEKGDTVIPLIYVGCYIDTIKAIGIVKSVKDGFIGIDKSGNKLFKILIFDNGPDYISEGLFRIIDDDEKVGFADMDGNIVISPQFEVALPFKNGFAAVCVGGYKETVEPDSRSHYVGGKYGFIDKAGKMAIEPQFDFVSSFHNDAAMFCVGGKSVLKGEIFVWEGGKWGVINTEGKIIKEPIFDNWKAALASLQKE